MVIQFYSSADVTGEKYYALIETGKDEVFEGFLALSRAQNFSSKRAYMRQENYIILSSFCAPYRLNRP